MERDPHAAAKASPTLMKDDWWDADKRGFINVIEVDGGEWIVGWNSCCWDDFGYQASIIDGFGRTRDMWNDDEQRVLKGD